MPPRHRAQCFIQTAIREWAYARIYQYSAERLAQLVPWVHSLQLASCAIPQRLGFQNAPHTKRKEPSDPPPAQLRRWEEGSQAKEVALKRGDEVAKFRRELLECLT